MRGPLPARAAVLFVAFALALAAAACRGRPGAVTPAGGPPPIVLVSIDTLRSDHLPAYGYRGVATPALDRLREEAILYERAYTPVPLTLPAHASLLTGLLPPAHGVRDNLGYRLDPAQATVAEILARRGYATGAAVASFVLRSETGLDQGFERYDEPLAEAQERSIGEIQRSGGATLAAARGWLRSVGGGPFFLFLHLYEPHTPYEPPAPFAARYASAYDGEIAAADQVVGDLMAELEAIGAYDRAVVVVLSDHGEGLGDHGEDEHGILLYREALQVPLLLKLPGGERGGSTVAVPVQLTDVAPTLLELAGAARQPGMEGGSLLAPPREPRPLYAETFYPELRLGWSALTSLIAGREHYIHGPRPELFDLVADPAERHDLLAERRRAYADMRQALSRIETRFTPPFAESEENRRALASLGYLGSVAAARGAAAPDPRSQIHTLVPFREGMAALAGERYEEAERALRRALELNPGSLDAWQYLGAALEEQGKPEAAYAAYREALQRSKGSPLLARSPARLALELGDREAAVPLLELAVEGEPERVELRLLLAQTLLASGRFEEALLAAEEAVAKAPGRADTHYARGAARIGLGHLEAAERDLRAALAIDPAHPAALSDLAVLLMTRGQREEARRLLRRLLELQPNNAVARRHLARIGE